MNQAGVLVPQALAHTAEVTQVRFSTLTSDQIELFSAMEVTQSRVNEAGQPTKGGVNDPRLGIVKPGQRCLTCGEAKECQGHFGHIKLAQPVFHVGYLPYVQKILKCICHNCGKMKFFRNDDQRYKMQQILRISQPSRRLKELVALLSKINKCEIVSENTQKQGCGNVIPTSVMIKEKMRLFIGIKENNEKQEVQYSALKVKSILDKISKEEAELLGFTATKPSDLLITSLAIAPPQVRPSVELGPEKRAEDDITNTYARIVGVNSKISQMDSYERALGMREIQTLIASIMVKLDRRYLPSIKERTMRKKKTSARKIKSLEERLIAKEGRFRQHLMGKRVDFSARSVISPDPFLALDEVGVPERIAKNLTIPEEINELNFERIVDLCKQGSVKYLLQPEVGKRTPNFIYLNNLSSPDDIRRLVTYGTIAERELQNGDYVLFNRQPTLHRMSMMAHRVRILPLNTFRLNLSVCSPYNADFDGDQMNMHVPQSVEATAELKHIALVPKQVISPKNSTPVMGIVQDSLLGIYLLTRRNVFLTREEFMNLLVWIEPLHRDELPLPCILKPIPLWSGKQIMSYLLPQKLSYRSFPNNDYDNLDDRSGLLIRKGEIITGSLQRHHVGPGSGALIHDIWMEIGPEATNEFITNSQRVVTCWLMNNSFSVGAADVMIDQELQDLRAVEVEKIKKDYYKNLHIFRNLPKYEHENLHQKGKKVEDSLEYKINLDLNNALSRMQKILADRISVQTNNIYKMITAKSKGSATNLVQIMFCLGNQNVDGQRCPLGFKRRALPHFSKDDNSPQPRGFVFSSFFQGLKPHQFFFHSMAGREGLSDTAVKTSSIGYIQRKLVKALQDLSIRYDGTVRDSQNNLFQRCYGEDGFQPEYIEKHKLNDCKLAESEFRKKYLWSQLDFQGKIFSKTERDILQQEYDELLKARAVLREKWVREGDLIDIEYYCPANLKRLIFKAKEDPTSEDIVDPITAIYKVRQLLESCVLPHFKQRYDNSMKKLNRAKEEDKIKLQTYYTEKEDITREAGAQMFHSHLKLWLSSTKVCNQYKLTKRQLQLVCKNVILKFKQALAAPGEAIGSLAAQSIGQPTTQMTLNTFHLAGVSDKNVTLGIPRLRQLLDVSKKIKTPFMTIYYYRQLLWQNRNSTQLQHIHNIMLSILPERHIRNCLSNSKIYFDPGQFESNIDGRELDESLRGSRTPIVLCLQFETEKITSAQIWRGILKALRRAYEKQPEKKQNRKEEDKVKKERKDFEVTQYVGIGQAAAPEIHMRLLPEYIGQKGYEKAMRHISEVEIELKDIFLSGMKGIKSIKTARKISYQYGLRDQMNSALELRQDELVFDAIGSNLFNCLGNQYVNGSKTTSNDLYEIYQVLGIEAARQCFINQIKEILKPYSIYINQRHISVLADWMTSRGSLTPVNRHGINRVRDVSILRKASFEETVDILYSAAVFSEIDQLRGVSERIIFGEKLNLGTNICEVNLNPDSVGRYYYKPASMNLQEDLYQPPDFPTEEGLNTPKGLATPVVTFSPLSSQLQSLPSESMSPSYYPSRSNQEEESQRSSSPHYLQERMEESVSIGQMRDQRSSSPIYQAPLFTSSGERTTFMYASHSPSYDRGSKMDMVRPREDLKEEESDISDSDN